MREMCIRPIIEDIQPELSDGMRSTVSTLKTSEKPARIPGTSERTEKSKGTEGSNDKATQGRFFTFWHHALGYKEKWFPDEYKAKQWAMTHGYRMD